MMKVNQPITADEFIAALNDDFDWEGFKVELNNFIIMHAPEDVTIGQAEKAMIALISALRLRTDDRGEGQ